MKEVDIRFFMRSGIPVNARPAARIDWTLGMYILVSVDCFFGYKVR